MTTPAYFYNPHQHIKIWLSNNPELFMNLENQIRLVKMRETNPNDQLHLVYDSSLLAQHAIDDLTFFCNEHYISPVDANKFKVQLQSASEHQLFDFYQDEIQHLNEGGNLAVASDILRWLAPVYRLGTYSDFDYPIDTSALPPQIEVKAPLLLNLGSLKLGKQEFIFVNNDYVAVVDEKAAQSDIQRVQQGIIQILRQYDADFIESFEKKLKKNLFNRILLKSFKNRSEAFYIKKSKELNQSLPSRKIRHYIRQMTSNVSAFIDFNKQCADESREEVIKKLRNNLNSQLHPIKYLFFRKEYTEIQQVLKQDDKSFLNYLMKKEFNLYLKSIIVCTTGPINISKALFEGYLFDTKCFSQHIKPYSFNNYQLKKAFQSQNSIPLHENPLGMLIFLGKDEGELNDSSWLESGRKLQEIRVNALKIGQKEFASNLPSSLLNIKAELESHTPIIKSQKETLKQILSCFHEDGTIHEFDIGQFKDILIQFIALKGKIYSKLLPNKTEKLVKNLNDLTHHALVYSLTKNRKIRIDKGASS